MKSERIKLVIGDGREGYAQDGPYNAIHVGAAAKKLPQNVSTWPREVGAFVLFPDVRQNP